MTRPHARPQCGVQETAKVVGFHVIDHEVTPVIDTAHEIFALRYSGLAGQRRHRFFQRSRLSRSKLPRSASPMLVESELVDWIPIELAAPLAFGWAKEPTARSPEGEPELLRDDRVAVNHRIELGPVDLPSLVALRGLDDRAQRQPVLAICERCYPSIFFGAPSLLER